MRESIRKLEENPLALLGDNLAEEALKPKPRGTPSGIGEGRTLGLSPKVLKKIREEKKAWKKAREAAQKAEEKAPEPEETGKEDLPNFESLAAEPVGENRPLPDEEPSDFLNSLAGFSFGSFGASVSGDE